MLGFLNWLQIGTGAVVGAMAGGALFYAIGHWQGDAAGYARFAAEQTVETLEAEKTRNRDDAELQRMSDYDFCVRSLGDRGLSVDACEQLRGLPGE